MSASAISPSLRASARAAYRDLWRASASTFAGDTTILQAWRQKMRNDALAARTNTDSNAYAESVKLSREIATILRRNIAQIQKAPGQEDTWRLRMTEHTELGDNATIKDPKPIEIGPKGRRRTQQLQFDMNSTVDSSYHVVSHSVDSPSSNIFSADMNDGVSTTATITVTSNAEAENVPKTIFYSQLKKLAKERVVPELREEDLQEVFVRGHGPGGQSINKTNNNVQLIHRPTGIRVVCQQTRSLALNRMYARRILLEKLDKIANPGLSKGEVQRAKQIERERRRRKNAKKERDEGERAARKQKRKEEKRLNRDSDIEHEDV